MFPFSRRGGRCYKDLGTALIHLSHLTGRITSSPLSYEGGNDMERAEYVCYAFGFIITICNVDACGMLEGGHCGSADLAKFLFPSALE